MYEDLKIVTQKCMQHLQYKTDTSFVLQSGEELQTPVIRLKGNNNIICCDYQPKFFIYQGFLNLKTQVFKSQFCSLVCQPLLKHQILSTVVLMLECGNQGGNYCNEYYNNFQYCSSYFSAPYQVGDDDHFAVSGVNLLSTITLLRSTDV